MKHWHFFHRETGAFHPSRFSAHDASMVPANTPKEYVAIEGEYDHLAQRVNVATGVVEDCQPERPHEDCEWDTQIRQWVPTAKRVLNEGIKRRIGALEGRQSRAVRELALGDAGAKDAKERLQAIDDEIAALRAELR